MADSILNHMLRVWGAQWRRIALGGTVVRNAEGEIIHRHIDGYPSSSLSNFADKVGFGTGGEQQWAEVYTGDGLIIHRGMQRLGEQPRIAIVISYGIRNDIGLTYSARERADFMGVSKATFWQILNAAEQRLVGFIEGLNYAETDQDPSRHLASRDLQHIRTA